METILRYTRTPLFDTFYAFLHPFVILLTGYLIYSIFKLQRYIGLLVLLAVLIVGFYSDISIIKTASVNSLLMSSNISSQKIISLYPDKNFAIYDYQFQTSSASQTLSLIYSTENRIDDHGIRIGVSNRQLDNNLGVKFLFAQGNYTYYDLNSISEAHTIAEGWVFVNPSAIYASTQSWYKGNKNK